MTHDLVFELSDRPLPDEPVRAAGAWEATEHRWQESAPPLSTQLRGNLPQAFVHALMLEAACRLSRPWNGPDV